MLYSGTTTGTKCFGAGAGGSIGVGRVRLRRLSLSTVSDGVGNFKIQLGISKLVIHFSSY